MSESEEVLAAVPVIEVSEEQKQLGEKFKAEGNEFFKNKHFVLAVDSYTKAIEANPRSAVYFSNRAFARIRLEEYGSAIQDATDAIAIDKNFIKAYYRRADANLGIGKYQAALRDFKTVLKCAPKDADAKRKCDECDKLLRERAFAKAIAGEVEKPISTTLDINSLEVSSSYTGLRLDPETGITFEFVQSMINEFKEQRKIHYKYAYQIIIAAIGVLSQEKTVVDIEVPEGRRITVCGDVHGQYYDVLNIFQMNGLPSNENPYVFNGDFVDRGSFSAEIILTFFAFKVLYPRGIFLMRGNHETNNMNKMYGFEGEMVAKYNRDGFLLCAEAFCHLPLCSVLGNKVLILHGGLFSDDKVTLADLRALDRNRQPPESGPMSELLWSDPQKAKGRGPSKRGVGSSFGPDITHKFLDANNLELLVRSHEVKDEGYEVEADGRLITIFSAPNYCDQMGNKGAFIHFGSDYKPKFTQFAAVPHPSVKPMAYANPLMNFS